MSKQEVSQFFGEFKQVLNDMVDHYEITEDIEGFARFIAAVKAFQRSKGRTALVRINRDAHGHYWIPEEDIQQLAPNLKGDSSILTALPVVMGKKLDKSVQKDGKQE